MTRAVGATDRPFVLFDIDGTSAVSHYRTYYLGRGVELARVYTGIPSALRAIGSGAVLATATSKRIETAERFLRHHQLDRHFSLVGGSDDRHVTKAEIIVETLRRLGDPPVQHCVMIGDRHSDIAAGRTVGVATIGVSWGYGSAVELAEAGPDLLLDRVEDLPAAMASLVPEGTSSS